MSLDLFAEYIAAALEQARYEIIDDPEESDVISNTSVSSSPAIKELQKVVIAASFVDNRFRKLEGH